MDVARQAAGEEVAKPIAAEVVAAEVVAEPVVAEPVVAELVKARHAIKLLGESSKRQYTSCLRSCFAVPAPLLVFQVGSR